jgi:hypothetical protein
MILTIANWQLVIRLHHQTARLNGDSISPLLQRVPRRSLDAQIARTRTRAQDRWLLLAPPMR